MRLTRFFALGALTAFLVACGGGSNQAVTSGPTGTSGGTTTGVKVPPLAERAQLFAYDEAARLDLKVKKKSRRAGVEVEDVVFDAAGRHVAAYLVRPKSKPRAAVLWAHWFAEEPNANRTEFLPDALALAKAGVVSLLPQEFFPWTESLTGKAAADRQLAIDQAVQLRRALDVLAAQGGVVPVGFVGHDYGAMFGSLLIADGRPKAYVFMAADATFANWFVKYFVRGASVSEYQQAFAPLDPVNYVGEAAPASIFFQFAKSDRYVPGYIADKLSAAASDPKKTESYEAGHELDDSARQDRLAWLRTELGVSGG
jgi:dienelactone hydrolase